MHTPLRLTLDIGEVIEIWNFAGINFGEQWLKGFEATRFIRTPHWRRHLRMEEGRRMGWTGRNNILVLFGT